MTENEDSQLQPEEIKEDVTTSTQTQKKTEDIHQAAPTNQR